MFIKSNLSFLALIALASIAAETAYVNAGQGSPRDADTESDVATEAKESAQLSVPPFEHREYPDERPEWLSQKADAEGEIHRMVVVTEPCETVSESKDRLTIAIAATLNGYAAEHFGSYHHTKMLPIDNPKTLDGLISRSYEGSLTAGGQTMYESAAELQITPEIRAEIQDTRKRARVGRRLKAMGGLMIGGFLLLVTGTMVAGGVSRHVQRKERATDGPASR